MNARQTKTDGNNLTTFHIQVNSIATDRYSITVAVNNTETTSISQLPVTKIELSEYQSILKQSNKTFNIHETQFRIRKLGQKLFDFLIGDNNELHTLYKDALKKVGNRLLLAFSVDNSRPLMELPWEIICDHDGNFLGVSKQTSIIRLYHALRTLTPAPVKKPLKVLVVIPSPPNYKSVNTTYEWEAFNKSLEDLIVSGNIVVERLTPPTWATLRRYLRTFDFDIIHIISPLYFDETRSEANIAMEEQGNSSGSQRVKISDFAKELGETTTVRLVIMNTAEATLRGLLSVGQQLQGHASIPGICYGTMNPVARQLFIKQLYQEVCAKQPIDIAVTLARQQLMDNFNTFDWARPLLFAQMSPGHLFRMYQTEILI